MENNLENKSQDNFDENSKTESSFLQDNSDKKSCSTSRNTLYKILQFLWNAKNITINIT